MSIGTDSPAFAQTQQAVYTALSTPALTDGAKTAGTLTREGSTAIVTFNELGGTTYDNSSGLVGTMNIGGGGTVDASNNTVGVTYTNINMWAGAGLKDPHKMITMSTNGVNLNRCGLPGSAGAKVAVLDLGTNLTVTPSTI